MSKLTFARSVTLLAFGACLIACSASDHSPGMTDTSSTEPSDNAVPARRARPLVLPPGQRVVPYEPRADHPPTVPTSLLRTSSSDSISERSR